MLTSGNTGQCGGRHSVTFSPFVSRGAGCKVSFTFGFWGSVVEGYFMCLLPLVLYLISYMTGRRTAANDLCNAVGSSRGKGLLGNYLIMVSPANGSVAAKSSNSFSFSGLSTKMFSVGMSGGSCRSTGGRIAVITNREGGTSVRLAGRVPALLIGGAGLSFDSVRARLPVRVDGKKGDALG